MERLTKRDLEGKYWCIKGLPMFEAPRVCAEIMQKAVDRLAAYEDTGLEPEAVEAMKNAMMGKAIAEIKEFDDVPIDRIRELVQTERDGRLAKQKTIPGTGVWVVNRDEYGEACDVSGYMFLAEVSGFVILTDYISDLESLGDTMAYHAAETSENYDTNLAVFPADDCYLTREEAEAALEAERSNGDGT